MHMKNFLRILLIVCISIFSLNNLVFSANAIEESGTETKPVHRHSYGGWKTVVWPTCTQGGRKERSCSCGAKYSQGIPALGHDWGDWISNGNDKDDSCYRKCNRCGEVEESKHEWNQSHICNKCHEACRIPASHHYFPGGVGSGCPVCKKTLSCSGHEVLNKLPFRSEYTMVGNPNPMKEVSLNKITLNFSDVPYVAETGNAILDMKFGYTPYTHTNYAGHSKAYSNNQFEDLGDDDITSLVNKGWNPKDDLAKGNVDINFANWKYNPFGAWIEGGSRMESFTGSGTTYSITLPSGGHYWTGRGGGIWVKGLPRYTLKLFTNGGCGLNTMGNSTKIYGMVRTTYRDTDGNRIPGAPDDSIQTKLVYQLGEQNIGKRVTSAADHPTLDPIGWRYVGYKIYKAYDVPRGAVPSPEGTKDVVSVTPSFGNQKYTIVFIYERVNLNIQHILVTSTGNRRLNTNLNETARHLVGTQIVRSVNKEIFPGYILMSYEKKIKNNDYEKYDGKEYDYKYTDPRKEATTRPFTPEEKKKNPIPKNIISKLIPVSYDECNGNGSGTTDIEGYRKDKQIIFYYQSVDVKITHIDKKENKVIKSTDGITDLSYTKDLTGQYLNEVSLEVKKAPSKLFMNGRLVEYNALGYILDSVKIKFDGIDKPIIINKEVLEEEVNKLASPQKDSYKYIVDDFHITFRLNINDKVIRTIIQNILKKETGVSVVNLSQKMQRNTEITWYYLRTPKIVIRHEDSDGNSLITPEVRPILTPELILESKEFPGFEIKYYELDENGIKIQLTKGEIVKILNTGNDRVIIFIYEPIAPPESTDRVVELRSSDRRADKNGNHASEEYFVDATDGQREGAIPTSEDMYSNVIVESFHLKDGIKIKENVDPTQKFEIRFIKQYVEENKEDGNNDYVNVNTVRTNVSDYSVPFDIGYNYFTAQDAKLQIIDHSIVKNASVEQKANDAYSRGQLKLLPEYKNEPYMEFEKGGKLTVKEMGKVNFQDKKVSIINGTQRKLEAGLYNVVEKKDNNGNSVIKADFVLPSVEYVYPDIDELINQYRKDGNESIISAEIAEMKDNIYSTTLIKMDRLTVISDIPDGETEPARFDVFNGANVPLIHAKNRNYLVSNKIINLNPTPNLTSRDVLYSENNPNVQAGNNKIFVQKEALNKLYKTSADVYYRTKQELKDGVLLSVPQDTSIDKVIIDEPGNNVTVHTPVVDYATIKNTHSVNNRDVNDTWYVETKNAHSNDVDATLILGQEFTIKIPHSGQHRNLKGYGKGPFNWKGLYAHKNGINGLTGEPKFPLNPINNKHFAENRQVKFTFGVIYNNTYCPANNWISLGATEVEEFTFSIPEWEKELWKTGKHHIYTRVIAENCPVSNYEDDNSNLYRNTIQKNANTDINRYIAVKDFVVNVIGEILDLEIRATNDPGWIRLNSPVDTPKLPIGQPGQNAVPAYKYGIKLGYSTFFDITTTGWIGDTTESIRITPRYFFVPKAGGTAIPVDLYYKKSAAGPYIALKDNPLKLDTIMSKDCYRGTHYISRFAKLYVPNSMSKFVLDAGRELKNTYPLLTKYTKPLVNYSTSIDIGNTNAIKLPYATRLAYVKAIETLKTKYQLEALPTKPDGSIWDGTDYCIGHWYGAMWLPSSTIAIEEGKPAPTPAGNDKLKDGYIIVSFDDILSYNEEEKYLAYDPTRFENEGSNNSDIKLPNGNNAKVPDGNGKPAIIYELISDRLDFNQGMTH